MQNDQSLAEEVTSLLCGRLLGSIFEKLNCNVGISAKGIRQNNSKCGAIPSKTLLRANVSSSTKSLVFNKISSFSPENFNPVKTPFSEWLKPQHPKIYSRRERCEISVLFPWLILNSRPTSEDFRENSLSVGYFKSSVCLEWGLI